MTDFGELGQSRGIALDDGVGQVELTHLRTISQAIGSHCLESRGNLGKISLWSSGEPLQSESIPNRDGASSPTAFEAELAALPGRIGSRVVLVDFAVQEPQRLLHFFHAVHPIFDADPT